MMIAARNAFLMGARLPYDAEVEWIQSTSIYNASINWITGEAWVDTGIYADETLSCEVKFRFPDPNEYTMPDRVAGAVVLGDRVSSNNRGFQIASGNWLVTPSETLYGNFDNSPVSDVRGRAGLCGRAIDSPVVVRLGPRGYSVPSLSVDAVVYSEYRQVTPYTTKRTLPLMAIGNDNVTPNPWPGLAYIYYAMFWRGDDIVRDLIPVRVGSGSSAVGYLYDRANPTGGPLGNGLYPNAGTGAFVVGPDK